MYYYRFYIFYFLAYEVSCLVTLKFCLGLEPMMSRLGLEAMMPRLDLDRFGPRSSSDRHTTQGRQSRFHVANDTKSDIKVRNASLFGHNWTYNYYMYFL